MKKVLLMLGLILLISLFRKSQPASLYGLEYNPEDIVVAQPTCVHRLPLTKVNRLWRGKGIRSFTVVNNTNVAHDLNNDPSSQEHLEAYGYWEDDSFEAGTWRGGNVGDTRAAVTPFLAHAHFGETYKWMLYGDDDTLFYMTGVLKLLSKFDPEQPLAITDNIWFYAQHTNPGAPRCLPCNLNMSTIVTNHTFTPRPACPFCARALACGTYGRRYRCNSSHYATLEESFGQTLLTAAAGGADAAEDSNHFRDGMRSTAARYAAWMDHHVDLKAKYPFEHRDKPTMDWEMRDKSDWHTVDQVDHIDDTSGNEGGGGSGGRRRFLQGFDADQRPDLGLDLDLDPHLDPVKSRSGLLDSEVDPGGQQQSKASGGEKEGQQRRQRRLLERRKRPVAQGYVDGTPWLSGALGRVLGGSDDPERKALQLPYPFCARHDERLHHAPAPSCLLSVSGHGGSGIILSVGLMRMIGPEEALNFIKTQRGCGGGDCLLGRLLWFRMGIGFTDPGTALQYGAERYEKYSQFVDSNQQLAQIAALSNPPSMLLGRRQSIPRSKPCDHSCVWLFENVVGLHVRAQNRQVNATVLEMVKRIQLHKRAYEWILKARQDPRVAAKQKTVVQWIKEHFGNVSLLAH